MNTDKVCELVVLSLMLLCTPIFLCAMILRWIIVYPLWRVCGGDLVSKILNAYERFLNWGFQDFK